MNVLGAQNQPVPLEALVENILEAFVLFKEAKSGFVLLRVNSAFERMSGCSAAAVLGKSVREVLPELETSLSSVAAGGKPARFERYSESFGRYLEVSLFRPDDGLLGAFLHDITERRRQHAQLLNLSRAVEQSPATVVVTDVEGRIVYVNPKFTELTGYQPSEVLGQNPRILKSGTLPAETYRGLWETVLAGREWRGEMHNRKKNGELYWEFASISPITDEQGKITHFLAVKEDITAQKKAIRALKESEERFRQLAENIPGTFWMIDCRGRLLYASPNYETVWGRTCRSRYYAPESWIGSVDPRDRERVRQAYANLGKTGKYDETYRIVGPNGTGTRWIYDRAFPIYDSEGKVSRWAGIAEDISERKQLDEKFLRTQRMESIGRLASGVAHDINNILTPILIAASMLRDKLTPEGFQMVVNTIEESAQRGASVVKQVLTFARGAEGSRVSIDPRMLLFEMERIAQETFPKSIQISTQCDGDIWPLNGDPTQLHQVLLNLCINARDAMPEGGRLMLSAENAYLEAPRPVLVQEVDPGFYVVFKVTDSGAGIPSEMLDKIFDPFFTTKELGKGTGLGLSTVLGIVRGHGGFVDVSSEQGRGAVFSVYIPALGEAETSASKPVSAQVPGGNGELVLLVDDEPAILSVTEAILTSSGYKVLMAGDGSQAFRVFSEHAGEIQAVVTDIMMPTMDGVSLIRALSKRNPGLKVIVSTGQADDSHYTELNSLGVRHFLSKPFRTAQLLNLLREILRG